LAVAFLAVLRLAGLRAAFAVDFLRIVLFSSIECSECTSDATDG
jgi:hypothetical protein